MRLDRDMRIDPANCDGCTLNLGEAHIRRAVDHLALQVRQRHRIVIDDPECADAGRREIEQRRRAEPARAHHQHARTLERGLAGTTDLLQHDMARIALELFGTQHAVRYSNDRVCLATMIGYA